MDYLWGFITSKQTVFEYIAFVLKLCLKFKDLLYKVSAVRNYFAASRSQKTIPVRGRNKRGKLGEKRQVNSKTRKSLLLDDVFLNRIFTLQKLQILFFCRKRFFPLAPKTFIEVTQKTI